MPTEEARAGPAEVGRGVGKEEESFDSAVTLARRALEIGPAVQARRVGRQEEREKADGLRGDCTRGPGGGAEGLAGDEHSDCRAVACQFETESELCFGFGPQEAGTRVGGLVAGGLEDELRGQDEGQGIGRNRGRIRHRNRLANSERGNRMKFKLEIELNSDGEDCIYAQLADKRDAALVVSAGDREVIRDQYGLTIGSWEVIEAGEAVSR